MFDNMGRLKQTTTAYSFVSGNPFTVVYAYDAASNRKTMTDPNNGLTRYSYDTLNRLSNILDFNNNNFGFSYDALSRRTQLTRPNGINTNYSYDSVSNLLSVLHQQGINTLDGASYTYDFAGNRASKTNLLTSTTSNFSYDNIYQLTGVTGPNPESYTYDLVGNRLTFQSVSNYAYNSSNELTTAGSATYTYDDNGNTRTKTDGSGTTTYNWDFENRLSSVQLPNSSTVTFKYDPFGRRIQKNGTSITNYVYHGANAIEEIDSSQNLLARYSQGAGIDEPLSELRSAAISYYEQDGLGSVTSLSSIGGALANTYVYDSFGNLTSSSGTVTNPFQYAGRDYDSETGLRYYRARYYDPTTGRFLSEDPIRLNSGDVNFYGYVENAPINATDPDGEKTKVCCRLLLGFMGFLTRQRHCFLFIDPEDGRPPLVLGLHKNVTLNGVYHAGGYVFPNFLTGDDKGRGADKAREKDCVNVDSTPCIDRQMYDNYTSAPCTGCGSNYKLLGPNSNTFVSDFLKYFSVVPPRVKRAPGY